MMFLKSQGKGIAVGLFVVVVWSCLDWMTAQFGYHADRNYVEVFCAAAAGASLVFYSLSSC